MDNDIGASAVPGEPGGFLTMHLAAEALKQRLRLLLDAAWERADERAEYYAERLRFITEMVQHTDPDDLFEQNAFQKSFTAELRQLPLPSEDASTVAAIDSGQLSPDGETQASEGPESHTTAQAGGRRSYSITPTAPRNTHPRAREK